MKGLCSGVSYCVLEAFERGDVRLVRLRDPWAGERKHMRGRTYRNEQQCSWYALRNESSLAHRFFLWQHHPTFVTAWCNPGASAPRTFGPRRTNSRPACGSLSAARCGALVQVFRDSFCSLFTPSTFVPAGTKGPRHLFRRSDHPTPIADIYFATVHDIASSSTTRNRTGGVPRRLGSIVHAVVCSTGPGF